jgi:putative oxidoreductase
MTRLLSVFVALEQIARRLARSFEWLPPTIARIGVGTVFVQSGWGKLHNLEQVTGFFTELGLPAPGFHAVLVSTTELVCGSLVLVGLLTRLAAVPLFVTMLVAVRTALWDQVDSLGSLFGLTETLYALVFLWLATAGPGPMSIDRLRARGRDRAPATASPVSSLAPRPGTAGPA